MWWTERGHQIMRGAEWALFAEGLDQVRSEVEWEIGYGEPTETSVRAFDELQPGQKLALLASVAEAMSDEAVPSPDLTSHIEATVAAVFRQIYFAVEAELVASKDSDPAPSVPESTMMRQLVFDAYIEVMAEEDPDFEIATVLDSQLTAAGDEHENQTVQDDDEIEGEEADSYPPRAATSGDLSAWEAVIDLLSERFLWDRDYENGDVYLNKPPIESKFWKRQMGIKDDYYQAIPPDPADEGLIEVRRTLRRVLGLPDPEAHTSKEYHCGLFDTYHDLFVGSLDSQTVEAASEGWLVESIASTEFDCSHDEWVENFRGAALEAQSQDPFAVYPRFQLDAEQREQAEAAALSGSRIALGSSQAIALRGEDWVITEDRDGLLVDLHQNTWSKQDDPDALTFNHPAKAMEAFLRLKSISEEMAERRRLAFEKLGRPDDLED